MYCAFILIHSDAYYWKKVPHTVMNRSSHGQAVHLTCAIGMIVQCGSCGPRYRQANRNTAFLFECLGWPGGKVHTAALKRATFTNIHFLYFFAVGLCSCVQRAESAHINVYRRTLHVLCMYIETWPCVVFPTTLMHTVMNCGSRAQVVQLTHGMGTIS